MAQEIQGLFQACWWIGWFLIRQAAALWWSWAGVGSSLYGPDLTEVAHDLSRRNNSQPWGFEHSNYKKRYTNTCFLTKRILDLKQKTGIHTIH